MFPSFDWYQYQYQYQEAHEYWNFLCIIQVALKWDNFLNQIFGAAGLVVYIETEISFGDLY